MNVSICDRCGDVTVAPDPCRCATAHDSVEARRRHRKGGGSGPYHRCADGIAARRPRRVMHAESPNYASRSTGRLVLRCGTSVRVRPIGPADAPELRRAFEALSATSRYRRFFTGVPTLSEAVLRTLTEIDHVDAEALVALPDEDATTIVGVARFVRDPHEPTTADLAVTVAEDWHRRGLGGALVARLGRRAREVGIHRFSADMLAENRAVLALVRAAGGVSMGSTGSTVTSHIAIDDEH